MKKYILILIATVFMSPAFSQVAFQQGDNQLNFGFNLGQGPGFFGSYEAGITDNISLGGELGVGFSTTLGVLGYSYFQANFRFSAFGNYHFAQLMGIPDEWDIYGGVDLGYSVWTRSSNVDNQFIYDLYSWKKNTLMAGVHGGGRWFWTEKWGVNAEVGGGYGYFVAKGGLTMKL
jgi:hypothetical protein